MRTPPAVVMVAYGDPRGTLAAIAALEPPADSLVVVVDNSGADELADATTHPPYRYIVGQGNVGFARGVNLALDEVPSGRDVLLLNPDARLAWANVLRLQSALHERPGTAAVAPRLVDPGGSAQRVSWPIPTPAGTWLDALGVPRDRPVFLSGAVLLLDGEALRNVGRFDERFFLYAEETDWQMRALRSGWTLRVADDVVATHEGAGTSSDESLRLAHFVRSGLSLQRKWYGPTGARVAWLGSVAAAGRRSVTGDAQRRDRGRRMVAALWRARP